MKRIEGTPARFSAERIEREGVSVLCVRLAGHAENNPNGVSQVCEALDDFAAALPGLEVKELAIDLGLIELTELLRLRPSMIVRQST